MFFPFRPISSKEIYQITYTSIIREMKKASKLDITSLQGRKYAVMDPKTGKTFSPKLIIGAVLRTDYKFNGKFHGGKGRSGVNQVFKAFGFPVGNRETLRKLREEHKTETFRLPTITALTRQLFGQRWQLLPNKIPKNVYPGVYLLSYSKDNLRGELVKETDVYYIGMTREGGLGSRLRQLCMALRSGGYHSGGDRFYRIWLRRGRYVYGNRFRFYFAYLPVKCVSHKAWRTDRDVLILSRVPELELAAIAHVKRKIGYEPILNTQ
jgi:hypothetical protein